MTRHLPFSPTPAAVVERARNNATFLGGCLVSNYSVGSHGYAQVGWAENGKNHMRLVHRVIWEAVNGEIPDGQTVDHTCKNRKCLMLSHLRMLPNFENARRTSGRDWPLGFCLHGHPNTEIRVTSSGKRHCRLCAAEWQRRYRLKKKASA